MSKKVVKDVNGHVVSDSKMGKFRVWKSLEIEFPPMELQEHLSRRGSEDS